MSLISQYIKENIVDSAIIKKQNTLTGTVLSYNNKSNRAKIAYTNPYGGGIIVLEDVLVSLEPCGIKTSSLKAGDSVLLSFIGEGNAIVTRYLDHMYGNNTRKKSQHKRKGSYIPNILCENISCEG